MASFPDNAPISSSPTTFETRSRKYRSKLSGLYSKAKQRFLNKIGKRTLLTRHPKADGMNKRIRNIDRAKNKLSMLADKQVKCLEGFFKASIAMSELYLELWKTEGCPYAWSESSGNFDKQMNAEQESFVASVEKDYQEMESKQSAAYMNFLAHLEDIIARPLTVESPEEALLIRQLRQAKKEYKQKRTHYSDSVINLRTCHAPPNSETFKHLEENSQLTKNALQEAAEKFCKESWNYQQFVRKEMFDKVKHYFHCYRDWIVALMASMDDFYPWLESSMFSFGNLETNPNNSSYEALMEPSSLVITEGKEEATEVTETSSEEETN
eukprot:jgi/Galph1/544/GphlegSOOS_G5194.1